MRPPLAASLLAQSASFLVVGTIGFVVDAGLFFLLYRLAGLDILLARALAFSPAVLVTWLLNRTFTFGAARRKDKPAPREFLGYVLLQGGGIGINFAVFYLAVHLSALALRFPLIALALGAGTAMAFNFLGMKFVLYRR